MSQSDLISLAMDKSYSRSSLCGMKVLLSAMRFMESHSGSALSSAIRTHVGSLSFNPWELELVNGCPRWQNFLAFYSTQYLAAGYIRKNKGVWYLTEEGSSLLSSSGDDASLASVLFDSATEKYRASRKVSSDVVCGDNVPSEPTAEMTLDDVQSKAMEGFFSHIGALNPYQFQDLVAALFRSLGYSTPFVAPRGRDGGIDIIAYGDPLGATSPRLKVQVKHYPSSSVGVEVVRQIVGILANDNEVGVVVTSGTFTSEALRESRSAHRHIRLIDGSEFVSLWIENYSRLSDEDKLLMPITPIYFVSSK